MIAGLPLETKLALWFFVVCLVVFICLLIRDIHRGSRW